MKANALILAGLCGLAVAFALAMTAGSASADPAFHNRFSFPGEMDFPAGTLCDFNSNETFTVVVDFTATANGASTTVITESITHNNLDTGYSLRGRPLHHREPTRLVQGHPGGDFLAPPRRQWQQRARESG